MSTLDDLEARLQNIMEVQLLKYLPGYKAEDRVYQDLALAMHNDQKKQDGFIYVPNVYVIIAHPSAVARWRSEPHWIKELEEALHVAGVEAGFTFLTKPTITTAEDAELASIEIHIRTSFSFEGLPETQAVPSLSQIQDLNEESTPPNAFLIQDGTKVIPLNLPVINIGRRLNNQVVINDSRVSRNHAQLRLTKRRFTLFDLNSTGGTFINGQRISNAILFPGDIISLAGVILIFGQDIPTGPVHKNGITQPKMILPGDLSTPVKDNSMNGKVKKARKL